MVKFINLREHMERRGTRGQKAAAGGLLKLLEGSMVNVPPQGGRKHPDQEYIHVDTKNIPVSYTHLIVLFVQFHRHG